MEDFTKFRYDYFGEFASQQVTDNKGIRAEVAEITGQVSNGVVEGRIVEDSLMNFISEYFQGDVEEDFTMQIETYDSDGGQVTSNLSSSSLSENAFFDSSSNSESNLSLEMVSSSEERDVSNEISGGGFRSNNANGSSSDRIRRKSISYEIRFLKPSESSSSSDGNMRIQIIPKSKTSAEEEVENNYFNKPPPHSTVSPPLAPLPLGESDVDVRHENFRLRLHIQDLEKKLFCIERESEKVIAELTRIIKQKNDTISQLELQVAGIKFIRDQP